MKKNVRTALILLIWIALWQLAAGLIQNHIIFVGPLETLQALVSGMITLDFWRTIAASFFRILAGFLSAFLAGIFLAAASGHFSLLREFLEPLMVFLQSVPVASFVILALIWIGSRNLSVLITFLVVFPVIYRNVLEGLNQVNVSLLEMARCFSLSPFQKLFYLYRPTVMPYLYAGCKISLGMAWKSGVAAEVIGVPAHSIGEKLYMAKIYLCTEDLFAWTLVIILVSKAFEKLFLWLLSLSSRGLRESNAWMKAKKSAAFLEIPRNYPGAAPSLRKKKADEAVKKTAPPSPIEVQNLSKSYLKPVLSQVSFSLKPGGIYCLLGPSGCGKTTLLRLLLSLEAPDFGKITGLENQKISVVFQEDRLIDFLTPLQNVQLVSPPGSSLPRRILENLLDPFTLSQPVWHLSGGMKRRVAIARALAYPSQLILMDEPFTGLDEDTRSKTIRLIQDSLYGRTLLIITHQEEDAKKLHGEIIRLS